jgi:hypothetical protein
MLMINRFDVAIFNVNCYIRPLAIGLVLTYLLTYYTSDDSARDD